MQPAIQAALAEIERRNLIARIWAKDHTVWGPEPDEITNRLGWLTVPVFSQQRAPDLLAFAALIRSRGIRDIVLLGMGGSSLAPEVLRRTFRPRAGWPRLHVLDSTMPGCVERLSRAVHPEQALYVVSSKSGGTIEVLSFFRYFFRQAEQVLGSAAGDHFVAITDPGTGLERLAGEHGFQHVFLNPPDIGGRFSALSHFGLVPAALAGLDPLALLEPVEAMAIGCSPATPLAQNPGAGLGAALAAGYRQERDKVTLLTSPAIEAFSLWAEQLLAESTGKEGHGLLPIAQEPPAPVACYGKDRQFVYLRLQQDRNRTTDRHAAALEQAGHPVVRLELRDRTALGAEFYRWEFATAVAGALIGVQPFDQPNVQESKDLTARVLSESIASGRPPKLEGHGDIGSLLVQARPGDYVALTAYVVDTPHIDRALQALRLAILERHRLATTLGYGPRYLHSTGQFHKGGPATGLFVQLTADTEADVPVPGEAYSFATLAAAQAEGDFRALAQRGRRIVRLALGRHPADSLRALAGFVRSA